MDWTEHCIVVIPCLDEGRRIGPLVTEIRLYLPKVLVIDDGSSDDTVAAARAAGADVVRHDAARGKGAALNTGWKYAWKRRFQWALCMDGDGQHAPADIPKFLACSGRTGAKLVVGNRMEQARLMPWLRRGVNRWMSRNISKLAGLPLPDSQCGFRLINLAAWSRLPIQAEHFEIESDTLLAFAWQGLPIEFVPIQTIYNTERSKISPWRDTIRWLRWRWRIRRPLYIPPAAVLPQNRMARQ